MRQAVILAGGMGTRLGSLTNTNPKPMLEIGGQPFLQYLIDNLARYGAENIVLLTGPHGKYFRTHIKKLNSRGIKIDIISDVPAAGTAGAVKYAYPILDNWFLLLNGDSYFDFNILDFTTRKTKDLLALMALRRLGHTSRYGLAELRDERIVQFGGKSTSESSLVNGGVYWVKKSLFQNLRNNPYSLETDIFPEIAASGDLGGIEYDGHFIDIGVPEDFRRAQKLMLDITRRPAAFLDRDGIINHDTGYVWKPEKYKWMEGSIHAIKRLNDLGYYVFVVTNQAGVARGLYREDDIRSLHSYINEFLQESGAHIDAFYWCPHHPDFGDDIYRQHCNCRKPKPGMLLQAMSEWPVDLNRSFMIGDKDTDIQAGKAAGVPLRHLFLGGSIQRTFERIAPPIR